MQAGALAGLVHVTDARPAVQMPAPGKELLGMAKHEKHRGASHKDTHSVLGTAHSRCFVGIYTQVEELRG